MFEFQGRNAFRGIDHHWRENLFATAGATVEVWSHERSEPVSTFSWGADTVLSVKFNPVSRVVVQLVWLMCFVLCFYRQ